MSENDKNDKIACFFKRHGPSLAIALGLAFIVLWLAVATETMGPFLRLAEIVLSPQMVFAAFGVWVVVRYSDDIRRLINRIRINIGGDVKSDKDDDGPSGDMPGDNIPASYSGEGNAESEFRRGVNFRREGNYKKAVDCFRKAAEKNHPHAQNNLGVRYAKGEGVEQNQAEAAKWYLRAAKQGLRSAQDNYGDMCAMNAFVWYALAAEQGHPDAIVMREKIRGVLSEGRRKKAEREIARLTAK